MPTSATGTKILPCLAGEGDRTKCGGGAAGAARRLRRRPLHQPTAGPPPHRDAMGRTGFTLIELLVVLTIIGLMSAAVVLAIPDPRGSLTAEAERFAARAKAAQDRAILDARAMSVRVTGNGYAFERREETGWQPLSARPFEQQAWTEGTVAAGSGRIVFDSTGLTHPASLTLRREDEQVVVEFAYDGAIRVRA